MHDSQFMMSLIKCTRRQMYNYYDMILRFSGTSVRLLLIYGNREKFQHLPVDVRQVLLQDERLVRIHAALWTQLMFSDTTFSPRCSGLLLQLSPGSDTTPGLWRRRRLTETSGPPAPSPGLGSVQSEGSEFRQSCWEKQSHSSEGKNIQHAPWWRCAIQPSIKYQVF